MKRSKRALAALLAVLMAASSAPFAMASDTLPYLGESARGENQPYQHGYRAEDLLDWSPETDPWGDMLRAEVPLQDRNAALAATQANPDLSPETQWFTLAGDYGNAFFDSYPYTNEFSQYLFNFWQYTDYYGSWHGMPTEEVPESMYQDERGVRAISEYRKFEFGLVNLPNPGYTNAAHKNGVLSIGCIFLPRTGLKHTKLLTQDEDGNFPYAEKLVEMCEYYGIDGWFINQEEAIPSTDIPLYKAFMKQMRDAGLYIQWYDSVVDPSGRVSYQNEFNSSNSPFVSDGETQYSDSIFLNYWWDDQMLASSADHAVSLGLNPLEVVFAGIEAGGDRWGQQYDLRLNIGENGQPMNSIASLGSEFVHDGLDEDLDNGANDNIAMRREKDEFQWMTFERERRWWSGPFQDPSQASYTADRSTYPQNEAIGVGTRENQDFDGVAAYVTERSVINGDTFVTNFNTGHGLEYAINGEISNEDEWSNINIQDILPTWQWWFETDGTKLNADFDYGDEYKRNYDNGKEDVLGKEGSFDFDLVGAYNGGSSLVVYGKVDAENFMHLYKTDLDVTDATKVDVTFKKTSEDNVGMKLGVIFEDSTDQVVKLDIADSAAKSDGWVTSTVDLSDFAGKKVAAFGLVFDGEAEDYQVNIGRIAYTSGESQKPATPTGFTVDKAYDTNEMVVSWDMASYDDVKQYNLYAVLNGKEIYLGGTYDQVYYIKDLEQAIATETGVSVDSVTITPNETTAEAGSTVSFEATVNGSSQVAGQVTLELKAVSEDGTESDPAVATHNYADGVTNVEVTAEDGALNVTWEGGQADVVVKKIYSTDETTWTASGNNGCTVEVPTGADADFARYTMTITTPSGAVTTYDGRMDDSYCQPYTGEVAASNGRMDVPLAKDWYQMVYKTVTGGEESAETTITRYSNEMPTIAASVDSVMVKLIDYRGNESEWVTIPNRIGVTVSGEAETVTAGESMTFTANVKNYTETDAVTWSISGALDSNTTIDENGVLTVGDEEPASTITVTATSVENTSASASASVTVDPIVIVRPQGGELEIGGSQQYIVEKNGRPQPIANYEWSIAPQSNWWWEEGTLSENTTIDDYGYLTVGEDETSSAIVVTATKKGTELSYSTTVTLTAAAETEALSMKTMPQANAAPQSEEVSQEVTWTVEGATSVHTRIDADGNLTIGGDETAEVLTVRATSVADPSKSDTATVVVTPSKELLRQTYEYAQTLSTEGVVDSAVEIFENAMANAKAVLDNPDATVEEIYDAWNDLLEGIASLGLKQGDKDMLEQLINRADVMMSEADKFADTNWQQLVDALAEAKTVYDDGDAMQEDVDAAAEALLNAILAQRYEADKSILEDLINQANEIDTSLYTAESVQAFTAALKSANAILADESLDEAAKAEDAQANQAVIDEAVVDLQSALDNLVEASADDTNSGDNTGDDANKDDNNSSKDDPNKGPMDDNKNPATGDNNLIALGALAVLLTSAGAFVVIRRKSRA